jgi:hypothetical protein
VTATRTWANRIATFVVGSFALLFTVSGWLTLVGVLLALLTVATHFRKRRGVWLVALSPSLAALLLFVAVLLMGIVQAVYG